MSRIHTEYAYAKINPYLAVTGRRPDGYHTILSHMQAVTLCDVLTFDWHLDAEVEFTVRLQCSDSALACDDTNLVCCAAKAFIKRLATRGQDIAGTLTVQLDKHIPMSAGLAGGSADAAATLRGLNILLNRPFSTQELCDIGAILGADIPFCVQSAAVPAMTARGIGEQLTAAQPLSRNCYLVIACRGEGVSTPWAYRRLDEQGVETTPEVAEGQYAAFSTALNKGDLSLLATHSYNCFEHVVLFERPAAAALIDTMKKDGAVFARMSGSGPSVVGYFEDEIKARACADRLCAQGITAHFCQPLF